MRGFYRLDKNKRLDDSMAWRKFIIIAALTAGGATIRNQITRRRNYFTEKLGLSDLLKKNSDENPLRQDPEHANTKARAASDIRFFQTPQGTLLHKTKEHALSRAWSEDQLNPPAYSKYAAIHRGPNSGDADESL
jgi:hypothetical protein